MKRLRWGPLVTAFVLGLGGTMRGDPITFDVVGVVNRVNDNDNVTGVAAGDPFSGSFTYDTDTPDRNADPGLGEYIHLAPLGPNGLVLRVGPYGVATDPSRNWVVAITHFTSGGPTGLGIDGINLGRDNTWAVSVGSAVLEFPSLSFQVWHSGEPLVLGDDSLPTSIDLSDFSFSQVVQIAGWIRQDSGLHSVNFWLTPTAITRRNDTVPDGCATILLLGISIAVVRVGRRLLTS